MKTREDHIAFDMNYCQHYGQQEKGPWMECKAGMNLKATQVVPIQDGEKRMIWGPCISGHTLENPTSHCPHWLRRTREQGEARANSIERSIRRMTVIGPAISEWRKRLPIGKQEVIECPECKGRLHLSQAAYNGHVHGKCETAGCVSWME